ncbi:MAG: hypothetical protein N3D10_01940 [Candidatus Micrarchaeota archaeon]|nr:hypothetical protein [Candidatus Micrarchaeota archaeon]
MPLDLPLPKKDEQKSQNKYPTPQVRGFRIFAKIKSSTSSLISNLSKISFLFVSVDPADPEVVLALNVEARDISNNPYLFSIIYFKKDFIDVIYTVNPFKSPRLRKLEIISYVLNILSFCYENYTLDMRQLYQIVENILTDSKEYFSSEYQELFSKYDILNEEYERLSKKLKMVEDSKKELENQVYVLKAKNQELAAKLEKFEKYSDSVLAVKIQEWIAEHNGEINIVEFAKVYNVPESKVEQILNNLVAEGYLEGSGK